MSTDIPALERNIRHAYEAARGRENAPWKYLDGCYALLCNEITQSRRRECGVNSAVDHAARAREEELLNKALAEFSRWRDMERAQFEGESFRVIWDAAQANVNVHAAPAMGAS